MAATCQLLAVAAGPGHAREHDEHNERQPARRLLWSPVRRAAHAIEQAEGHAGLTATDLSGGQGHSLLDGTDAIVAYALSAHGGPTGTFADRDGTVPW
jgi:hypothetical protein